MASQQVLLSPAELAYLHSSLSLRPPIRPDGRSPTQFRPLTAETGVLPGTNGSARVCFADGTEAIVGVKAEIEKTMSTTITGPAATEDATSATGHGASRRGQSNKRRADHGREARADWVELTVEIPGQRDDEASTVFLGELLREALLSDGQLAMSLWINRRFHWRLYLDILLISPPMSYPLPLLSLTTHLALLSTRLPKLKSEGDEDPMFDDDWEASVFLYPQKFAPQPGQSSSEDDGDDDDDNDDDTLATTSRPAITLLVITVGKDNIIFDPSKEELAVAETVLAISVSEIRSRRKRRRKAEEIGSKRMDVNEEEGDAGTGHGRNLRLLSVRMIDRPSRLTPPGVPHGTESSGAAGGDAGGGGAAVWRAPVGGTKYGVLQELLRVVLAKGGVADEVLDGLDGVELV